MPRPHKKHVPIVAASPAYVAAMLCIRPDDMARAIKAGEIKVFQLGIRRRVVIDDCIQWLRKHPAKSKSKSPLVGVSHADHAD